jgi:hypothetical protein
MFQVFSPACVEKLRLENIDDFTPPVNPVIAVNKKTLDKI